MKAKFEFELPREKNEYLLAHRGGHFFSVLWSINNLCKDIIKNKDDGVETADYIKTAYELASIIVDEIMDANIDDIE